MRRIAVLLASAILAGACSGGGSSDGGSSPSSSSTSRIGTPSVVATTAPPPSNYLSPVPAVGPPGGPVTAGLRLTDLTFVDDHLGWALDWALCPNEMCASIVRTRDGGASWEGIPAPPAHLDTIEDCRQKARVLVPCIDHLRFATAEVGFAFGFDAFTTTDGGSTWQQEDRDSATRVLALEPSSTSIVRVIARPVGDVTRQFVQVRPLDGSSGWRDLSIPGGAVATLVHRDREIYFAPNIAENQQLYRSSDDGETWTSTTDPCGPQDNVKDASSAAPQVLVLLCGHYQSQGFVITSTDGGATFGPRRGVLAVEASHSPQQLVALTPQHLLVTNTSNDLLRSSDGGQSWDVVIRQPSASWPYGTFHGLLAIRGRLAKVILDDNVVARSSDFGATWLSEHVEPKLTL